jgi:hypothetical protein
MGVLPIKDSTPRVRGRSTVRDWWCLTSWYNLDIAIVAAATATAARSAANDDMHSKTAKVQSAKSAKSAHNFVHACIDSQQAAQLYFAGLFSTDAQRRMEDPQGSERSGMQSVPHA